MRRYKGGSNPNIFAGIILALMFGAPDANAQGKISPVCSRDAAPIGISRMEGKLAAGPRQSIGNDAARAATDLVYRIENGSDPYVGVTSNFDGEGMSLGLIQFNFGGSIQKTFGQLEKSIFSRTMPEYGDVMYRAVHSSPSAAKALSLQMQHQVRDSRGRPSWRLIPQAGQEVRAFLGSPEAKLAQDRAVRVEFDAAVARASSWAKMARGAANPSNREIAFFFDQQVFNGGSSSGMWVDQARAFRSSFPDDGAMIAFVAKWLESCADVPSERFLHGAKEGRVNAAAWRSAAPPGQTLSDEKALLFAQGYLRALVSNGPPEGNQHGIFKAQVTSRRGMIALGTGTGNGIGWPGGILEN